MRDLSKLSVCFLAGTLAQGGAERQLFYILQALCQAGATPRLLTLNQGEFWEETIKALGVSVTSLGNQPSRLKRLFRIVKELRRDRPDVIQSQHFYTNAYASLAAAVLRAKAVGAIRSNGQYEVTHTGALGSWLNLRLPRTIAVNSRNAMRYAIGRGVPASRLYFLPNVVDTQWFKPSGYLPQTAVTLVAVGRLVKEKRFDRFISALSRLRAELRLDVRGLIVGPSSPTQDLRPGLERQARALGLYPDRLQFLGGVSDIRSIFHQASICVLTSDWEGTPNVLLEAMACGLPIVSTNVGGVPDIVEHGRTGFLFEPNDLDGLVAGLARLVEHRELRATIAQNARTFVEENHSLSRLPTPLGHLYDLTVPATGRGADAASATGRGLTELRSPILTGSQVQQ
jgi:glycosyltransferase involved in cell wall biosynthesis